MAMGAWTIITKFPIIIYPACTVILHPSGFWKLAALFLPTLEIAVNFAHQAEALNNPQYFKLFEDQGILGKHVGVFCWILSMPVASQHGEETADLH